MLVAGVDEVGRGPLAGPVITAAVILPMEFELPGLNDSKKVSKIKREKLAALIKSTATSWAFGLATIEEIDRLNILHATMLAMQRAVKNLSIRPDLVLVDGNRSPDFAIPSKAIVGGDGKEESISAASIIAKVERDRIMSDYADIYPQYGFERNSGYPTKQHREALIKYGPTEIHRKSFAPVQAVLDFK